MLNVLSKTFSSKFWCCHTLQMVTLSVNKYVFCFVAIAIGYMETILLCISIVEPRDSYCCICEI